MDPMIEKKPFGVGYGILAEMEYARSQHGVRVTFAEDSLQMFQAPGSSAGDDGNRDRGADCRGELDVVAIFGPVCIHTGQ